MLIEKRIIRLDHSRPTVQARACSGSMGQGKCRARNCIHTLSASMVPETPKTRDLFSERIMSDGNVDTRPTSVAPIPNETSKAGRAQQISVLNEVNKLKKGRRAVRLFTNDFFNSIACILEC